MMTDRENAINALMHYMAKYQNLKNAINEFLSHSMEFTTNPDCNGEICQCPICFVSQDWELSTPLKHLDSCHLSKLAKALEETND